MSPGVVNLARIGAPTTLHHIVEPKPLRGTPQFVKARCGRAGEPKEIVRGVDERALRVGVGVVCVNCIDLNVRPNDA